MLFFKECLSHWFKCPSVKKCLTDSKLSPKALLLLDNAPAHPEADVLVSTDQAIKANFRLQILQQCDTAKEF